MWLVFCLAEGCRGWQNCQHQALQYCQRVERPHGATAGAYIVWQSRNTPRQIQTHTMGNNGKQPAANSSLIYKSMYRHLWRIYNTHTHPTPLQNRKTGYSYPPSPITFIKLKKMCRIGSKNSRKSYGLERHEAE